MRYLIPVVSVTLFVALVAAAHGVWSSQESRPSADEGQPAGALDTLGGYAPDGRYEGPWPTPGERPPNLIVLVLDGLRSDCLRGPGEEEDAAPEMPYLARLAERGAHLTQVTAASPGTLASLTSLLTGLPVDRHRVDDTGRPPALPSGVTTFAEVLGTGHDFETAAVTALPPSEGRASLLQGFRSVRTGESSPAIRASIRAWNRERRRDRPFLLLLHSDEASAPYGEENHPPDASAATPTDVDRAAQLVPLSDAAFMERFLTDRGVRLTWLDQAPGATLRRAKRYAGAGFAAQPDPELAGRLEAAYRRGVRWVDGEIEKTVGLLEEEGLLEDTLLIVVGGHGEAFGEHGVLGHGRSLHEELVHVPLVAIGPAPFAGGRAVSTSIGLVDVLPTFLELAELPPLGDVAGRSMLSALREDAPGRAVLSMEELTPHKMGRFAQALMISARTGTETYIVTYDLRAGTIVERLYDRAVDPGEHNDLATRGRVDDEPVSKALADAIESVRDRIWRSADASQQFVQLGYGAGVGTVSSKRPRAPTVRPD